MHIRNRLTLLTLASALSIGCVTSKTYNAKVGALEGIDASQGSGKSG